MTSSTISCTRTGNQDRVGPARSDSRPYRGLVWKWPWNWLHGEIGPRLPLRHSKAHSGARALVSGNVHRTSSRYEKVKVHNLGEKWKCYRCNMHYRCCCCCSSSRSVKVINATWRTCPTINARVCVRGNLLLRRNTIAWPSLSHIYWCGWILFVPARTCYLTWPIQRIPIYNPSNSVPNYCLDWNRTTSINAQVNVNIRAH